MWFWKKRTAQKQGPVYFFIVNDGTKTEDKIESIVKSAKGRGMNPLVITSSHYQPERLMQRINFFAHSGQSRVVVLKEGALTAEKIIRDLEL